MLFDVSVIDGVPENGMQRQFVRYSAERPLHGQARITHTWVHFHRDVHHVELCQQCLVVLGALGGMRHDRDHGSQVM